MTYNQPNGCNAEFTINDQRSNQKVNIGDTVTLRAVDTGATTHKWTVVASPPESKHELKDSTRPQATLSALEEPGAYVIQLEVAEDQCVARAHHIVWAATPQRGYRLPAPGEPLDYDGDMEWAGDLVQVIRDVDSNLPSEGQLLTEDERKGLDAIEEAHAPGQENPFVTASQLPREGQLLAEDERKGLDAIEEAHAPGQENPFVTASQLPREEQLLTEDERKGLDAIDGEHPPGEGNPFVTRSQWSPTAPTEEQKAALDALEDLLGPGNRIATLADIAQARTVATGNVDLGRASPSDTPGRVGVIGMEVAHGLATLSFPGYDPSRQQDYVVNVLPINKGAGAGGGAPVSVLVVEFVDFVGNGFQIRMSRVSTEGSSTTVRRELGRCMVEVSEMVG